MDSGYVRLWRKSSESAVFQDPHLWQLWTWCLFKAAWKPQVVAQKTGVGNTLVNLRPGQFIFGRKSAAKALKQPASSIRNRMEKLEKLGNLDTQVDTHWTIVTIRNWDIYQLTEERVGHALGQAEDTHRTPTGHKEEGKEGKKVKNKTNGHFVPPTLEQVRARIAERSISVDPERFIAHYQSNGWMVGKNKMKCWDSALTTWSKNPGHQQQSIWGREKRLN